MISSTQTGSSLSESPRGAPWGASSYRPTHRIQWYVKPLIPSRPKGNNRSDSALSDRREGDIAYLRPAAEFPESERAILKGRNGYQGGHLDAMATGHPVIVLRRLSEHSDHVLVTTVSAYSAGPSSNFLAPWKQRYHRYKNPEDFRSFDGSELSNDKYPALRLEAGSWPSREPAGSISKGPTSCR